MYVNMSSTHVTSDVSPAGVAYLSCGPANSDFALICVHGWGCRATDYTPLFEQLSRHAPNVRAVAVDLPGHGVTPKETCEVATVSAFAATVLSVIDQLGTSTVVLVGHSMGCRIILDTWVKAQGAGVPAIEGLVFVDGSNYKLRPKLFAFDSKDARSKDMSDEEKTAEKKEMFERMFSARTPEEYKTSTLEHIEALDADYSGAIRGSFIDYDHTDMDDAMTRLGKSETPLLSLQSTDIDAENQRIPLEAGQTTKFMPFVQEKVPHAQQVAVEDSAHFPHVDRPDVVAKELVSFLQSLEVEL